MATTVYRGMSIIATDESGKEYQVGGIPDVRISCKLTKVEAEKHIPFRLEYTMKISFWSRLLLKWHIRKALRRLKKQVKELEKIGEPHELTISIKRGESNGNKESC